MTGEPGGAGTVVVATHNAHKLGELRRILAEALPDVELVGYDGPEPVEDGGTFAENALIKARAAAEFTGLPAIADDSGIGVDSLGGAPGIHSARYAGTRIDADNREKLLAALGDAKDRLAHFECAAALVVPATAGSDGAAAFEHVEPGVWHGSILFEAAGGGGFGYDPVFKPDGYTVSAAELRTDEKNAISHRSAAFRRLAPIIRQHVGR